MTVAAASPDSVSTGDEGLDALCAGGLPRGRTTLIVGPPGSGKTILALQFLATGWTRDGEPGIFVGFEEPPGILMENVSGLTWGNSVKAGVRFIDSGGAIEEIFQDEFEIAGLLASIDELIAETGAVRLALDAIDALLFMLGSERAIRREVYRLYRWMQIKQLTTVVTAKKNNHYSDGPFSAIDYLSDCIIDLDVTSFRQGGSRQVSVLKMRGRGCAFGGFPLLIGSTGVRAIHPATRDMSTAAAEDRRLSSGIPEFDDMLGGGIYVASTTLITGLPGTGKTTLTASFARSACSQGERCALFSFDQLASALIRDLKSVSIDLTPHVESGNLLLLTPVSRSASAYQHTAMILDSLRAFEPSIVIIDSITAVAKAGLGQMTTDVAMIVIDVLQAQGATIVLTALSEEIGAEPDTLLDVSALADNWIHLTNRIKGGERNRGVSIVKSRGTAQSNQVRELVFTSMGVEIVDVYVSGGEVLMGTARLERDRAEAKLELARQEKTTAEALILEEEIQAMQSDVDRLKVRIARRTSELEQVMNREVLRKDTLATLREDIRRSRQEQSE